LGWDFGSLRSPNLICSGPAPRRRVTLQYKAGTHARLLRTIAIAYMAAARYTTPELEPAVLRPLFRIGLWYGLGGSDHVVVRVRFVHSSLFFFVWLHARFNATAGQWNCASEGQKR
jgi:hypothetical protein